MRLRSTLSLSLFAALVAAGCASTGSGDAASSGAAPKPAASSTAKQASVKLAPASGSLVSGILTLKPMGDGVHITGEIGGLQANSSHGFHIHEKGDCSAADASSAGGHFNPAATPHGRAGHGAHHAGDGDNLVADAQGVARVDAHFAGVSLGGAGANDIAGRALIVHANADDYSSQPAGNAGARVACGIIQPTP